MGELKIKELLSIPDNKIKSEMIVCVITIRDYLSHAKEMTKNNVYQRKRVKDSHTVYALLKGDLKEGCTFPPLVLACVRSDNKLSNEETINKAFEDNKLMILDGLQRTYTMIDVAEELEGDNQTLNKFLDSQIILEIYLGINRLGILYRMLTLNTGQTHMSLRHQIEILYEDLDGESKDDYEFYRQKDNKVITKFNQFQYKDAIECFYSYINRDPSGIDRDDVLEIVSNLEKLSAEKEDHNLFMGLIKSFSHFLKKMDNLTNHWKAKDRNQFFGKDILSFFNKSIVMSAYGACLGELKDSGIIKTVDDINSFIDKIELGCDGNDLMLLISKNLADIKADAKKIGLEHRDFFFKLFKYLFVDIDDGRYNFKKSLDTAYNRYKILL